MARKCTICSHEQRNEIERATINGESYRHIASQFGVGYRAVGRHAQKHLIPELAKARDARQVADADMLLVQVRALYAKAVSILRQAEDSGDLGTALRAIREARSTLELLAKLMGELQQEGTVNIVLMPQWVELRTLVVNALAPYPQARQAVVEALRDAGG